MRYDVRRTNFVQDKYWRTSGFRFPDGSPIKKRVVLPLSFLFESLTESSPLAFAQRMQYDVRRTNFVQDKCWRTSGFRFPDGSPIKKESGFTTLFFYSKALPNRAHLHSHSECDMMCAGQTLFKINVSAHLGSDSRMGHQ